MSDCNEYLHDGDETDSKAHNSGYGHGHPKEPRQQLIRIIQKNLISKHEYIHQKYKDILLLCIDSGHLAFEEEDDGDEEIAGVKIVVVEHERLVIVHQWQHLGGEDRVQRDE
jgi:hypothetical protein